MKKDQEDSGDNPEDLVKTSFTTEFEIADDSTKQQEEITHIAHYRIISELGIGGFGKVYEVVPDEEKFKKLRKAERSNELPQPVDLASLLASAKDKMTGEEVAAASKFTAIIERQQQDELKTKTVELEAQIDTELEKQRRNFTAKLGESPEGKRLALKTVVPMGTGIEFENAVERIRREYTVSDMLRGRKNIVQVYDFGKEGDIYYIVMEVLPREIKNGRIEDWTEAVRIVKQSAVGLHEMHRKGTQHRDIKPQNLRMREDGTVVLTDMGLVKRRADRTLSIEGSQKGTIAYMSPEQARGEKFGEHLDVAGNGTIEVQGKASDNKDKIDDASDLYSLGAVLYEFIAGKPPEYDLVGLTRRRGILSRVWNYIKSTFWKPVNTYYDANQSLQMLAIGDERTDLFTYPREANPECPKDLERITLKLLSKDKRYRYQSARELIEDLERLERGKRVHARPLFRRYFNKWLYNHPLIVNGIAALAITVSSFSGIRALMADPVERDYQAIAQVVQEARTIEEIADPAASLQGRIRILEQAQETIEQARRLSGDSLERYRGTENETRFSEMDGSVEDYDDNLEWRLAQAYRELISETDPSDPRIRDHFVNIARYIIESKVEWLIESGIIEPGEYPDRTENELNESKRDNWGRLIFNRGDYYNSGFWPGILWLAFEHTGENRWKEWAEQWTNPLIGRNMSYPTADIGVRDFFSLVKGYELTGNREYRRAALDTANAIIQRFREEERFIQNWGELNDPTYSQLLGADASWNLELLWWAFEQTGDRRFYDVAVEHLRTSANLVREDGSVMRFAQYTDDGFVEFNFHNQIYNYSNGVGLAILMNQYALAYRNTGIEEFRELYERIRSYADDNRVNELLCCDVRETNPEYVDVWTSSLFLNHNPNNPDDIRSLREIIRNDLNFERNHHLVFTGCRERINREMRYSNIDSNFLLLERLNQFNYRPNRVFLEDELEFSGFTLIRDMIYSTNGSTVRLRRENDSLEYAITAPAAGFESQTHEEERPFFDNPYCEIFIENPSDNSQLFNLALDASGNRYDALDLDYSRNFRWRGSVEIRDGNIVYTFRLPLSEFGLQNQDSFNTNVVINAGDERISLVRARQDFHQVDRNIVRYIQPEFLRVILREE
jgi:serine/threonine protein kinase